MSLRAPNETRQFWGPSQQTGHEFSSTIVSSTGAGVLNSGATEWYGYSTLVTAASTANIRFIDATATGIFTPVKWQITNVGATADDNPRVTTFARPIRFDKGMAWSVTATGGANVKMEFFWDVIPVRTGPGFSS